jgi:acyl dehydratase
MVGTNIGAGQRDRALRAAWIGAAIAAGLCETIGLCAAIVPKAWLALFDTDPAMLDAGVRYLQTVGPTYGLFGLGLALYFASQGAGRLLWPLLANLTRLAIAAGGGWLALQWGGNLSHVFVMQSAALVVFGLIIAAAVASGAWFGRPSWSSWRRAAALPLSSSKMTGRYLEDFAVGQTYGSGRVRIEGERIKSFAAEFDPQAFHLDEHAARNTIFRGLAASGWHTAALTMRLLVESELKPAGGIVGAGFDEFRWPRPVRPGDELRVESEVIEVRPSKSRPEHGLIKVRTTTLNQDGEAVQVLISNLIVPRRQKQTSTGT